MRIPSRPLAAYPWYLRPLFWSQRRKYGAILEPALLWARVPRLLLAFGFFFGALERKASPLPPALRALVTVRVSQVNWCRFCVDLNSALLMKRGAAEEKVAAVEGWRASNLFDESERAALEYAEAVTRPDGRVDDALMARLGSFFDDDVIVELTALIAFQNLSSKFNAALDVPAQGFCRLPGGSSAVPT
jgi:AhpD family alkylhydroperoxidase